MKSLAKMTPEELNAVQELLTPEERPLSTIVWIQWQAIEVLKDIRFWCTVIAIILILLGILAACDVL